MHCFEKILYNNLNQLGSSKLGSKNVILYIITLITSNSSIYLWKKVYLVRNLTPMFPHQKHVNRKPNYTPSINKIIGHVIIINVGLYYFI